MNKTQLIDEVAEDTGLSKAEAARVIESTINTITKAMAKKDSVALVGFCTLGTKLRAARIGRDPRTGGALQIPAAMVAFFKPGKALKEAINAEDLEKV